MRGPKLFALLPPEFILTPISFFAMDAFRFEGRLCTLSPQFTQCLGGLYGLSSLAIIAVLVCVTSQPAVAQPHQDQRPLTREQVRGSQSPSPSSSPSNLPNWAEPAQPQNESSSSSNATTKAGPPPPPPDPDPVPVDGGVVLLAAAGAGYAVRKLNDDEEGEAPVA